MQYTEQERPPAVASKCQKNVRFVPLQSPLQCAYSVVSTELPSSLKGPWLTLGGFLCHSMLFSSVFICQSMQVTGKQETLRGTFRLVIPGRSGCPITQHLQIVGEYTASNSIAWIYGNQINRCSTCFWGVFTKAAKIWHLRRWHALPVHLTSPVARFCFAARPLTLDPRHVSREAKFWNPQLQTPGAKLSAVDVMTIESDLYPVEHVEKALAYRFSLRHARSGFQVSGCPPFHWFWPF